MSIAETAPQHSPYNYRVLFPRSGAWSELGLPTTEEPTQREKLQRLAELGQRVCTQLALVDAVGQIAQMTRLATEADKLDPRVISPFVFPQEIKIRYSIADGSGARQKLSARLRPNISFTHNAHQEFGQSLMNVAAIQTELDSLATNLAAWESEPSRTNQQARERNRARVRYTRLMQDKFKLSYGLAKCLEIVPLSSTPDMQTGSTSQGEQLPEQSIQKPMGRSTLGELVRNFGVRKSLAHLFVAATQLLPGLAPSQTDILRMQELAAEQAMTQRFQRNEPHNVNSRPSKSPGLASLAAAPNPQEGVLACFFISIPTGEATLPPCIVFAEGGKWVVTIVGVGAFTALVAGNYPFRLPNGEEYMIVLQAANTAIHPNYAKAASEVAAKVETIRADVNQRCAGEPAEWARDTMYSEIFRLAQLIAGQYGYELDAARAFAESQAHRYAIANCQGGQISGLPPIAPPGQRMAPTAEARDTGTPPGTDVNCMYDVVHGDTLFALANKWGVTIQAIRDANHGLTSGLIAGKTIQKPSCSEPPTTIGPQPKPTFQAIAPTITPDSSDPPTSSASKQCLPERECGLFDLGCYAYNLTRCW